MKHRVFFGCSPLGAAKCSDIFDTENAARKHMNEEAVKMAAEMGVDIHSQYFRLNNNNYRITAGNGATYSGCLLPILDD